MAVYMQQPETNSVLLHTADDVLLWMLRRGSGKDEKNEWKEYPSNSKALLLSQAAPRHRLLDRGYQGGITVGSSCSCPPGDTTQ